jgi:hypothetical protein
LDELVLTAENPIFVTKAKMNAKEGTFVATETSKSMGLRLNKINATAGQTMRFYVAVLPTTNTTIQSATVNVISTDGIVYSSALTPGVIVNSGYKYSYTATLQRGVDEYDDKDYVDLGTGDGTLWGRNNVDVYDEVTPEFYAWFDVEPKSDYSWNTYDTYLPNKNDCEYCSPNFDNQSTMTPSSDDVAYLMMEPNYQWYIPTSTQWKNLVEQCHWTWTTYQGKQGYRVSNKSVPARWIFIPATGYMEGQSLNSTATYYWASDLDTDSHNWLKGFCLKITEGKYEVTSMDRCYGMSIRPVFVPNI